MRVVTEGARNVLILMVIGHMLLWVWLVMRLMVRMRVWLVERIRVWLVVGVRLRVVVKMWCRLGLGRLLGLWLDVPW